MKIGVVVFPGSNCDHDALHIAQLAAGEPAVPLWHENASLEGCQALIIPGGFSYGDYLRTGAIARFSPIMQSVREFVEGGGPVLGICNGFQILCEAGLLKGALLRNAGTGFVCRPVYLRVDNNRTPFTHGFERGEVMRVPIAHGEGNFYADPEVLEELEEKHRVVFRYCTHGGAIEPEANPNGSLHNIAGICNDHGNVVGLMPHPERASEAALGSNEGFKVFESLCRTYATHA
ncbi:MAG TPA: phosphoribosylformylglycinamidine synthase subunit PurQ [Terriglobales bacterium]|jgi:phosphoribosylformylglycinamidine synthase